MPPLTFQGGVCRSDGPEDEKGAEMPVVTGSSTPKCYSRRAALRGQCNRLVSSTTAANALTASEDIDKRALRLQVCELSCTQR